jgi:hypothetical protein
MELELAGTKTKHARDIDPADRYLQQAIATALGLSVRRVHQLTALGILTRDPDGTYSLTKAVEQYVLFRLRSAQTKSESSATNERLKVAKAQEIELKLQQRERTLIRLDEALAHTDWIVGKMLGALSGIPARITRNPRERQRIEQIINGVRARLAEDFERRQRELEAGHEYTDAAQEHVL